MGAERTGRKVCYVTDTTWRDSIPKEVAGSDLLVCEAMFGEEFAESAREKKHLTARQAGQLASAAGGIQAHGAHPLQSQIHRPGTENPQK